MRVELDVFMSRVAAFTWTARFSFYGTPSACCFRLLHCFSNYVSLQIITYTLNKTNLSPLKVQKNAISESPKPKSDKIINSTAKYCNSNNTAQRKRSWEACVWGVNVATPCDHRLNFLSFPNKHSETSR